MPPYPYRSPPSGRQYYEAPPPSPQRSTWHFNDWQSALPENVYFHTWVASPSSPPPMSTPRGDEPQARERAKEKRPEHGPEQHRRQQRGRNGQSSRGDDEEGRGGGGGGAETKVMAISNAAVTRPDAAALASDRDRRLVEFRLLLTQLHEQLKTAHDFYKPRLDEFTAQTSSLRTFADKETLDRIWTDKLRAETDKAEGDAARNRNARREVDCHTIMAQIDLCLRHVKTAATNKLPAVPGFLEKNTVAETQISIVISVVEEVKDLSLTADTDHYSSEDIVPCLDKAMALTDTRSQVWKAVLEKLPAAGLKGISDESKDVSKGDEENKDNAPADTPAGAQWNT